MERYPHVHAYVAVDEAEDASLLLWELGAIGVEQRDVETIVRTARDDKVTLVASFATVTVAEDALQALPGGWEAELQFVEGDAWRDEWRKHFKTLRIGRLVIRPSWEPPPSEKGLLVMTLDPGRAFGTGTHESTRLVLGQLEQRVSGGESLLDLGCGSGILSIAGLLLGAGSATGVDIDGEAVRVAMENARLNGVADRFEGTTTPIEHLRARFDLVLANIESRVLVPCAPAITRLLAPGGTLVLSGLLVEEADHVLSAYADLRCVERPVAGDWIALVMRGRG